MSLNLNNLNKVLAEAFNETAIAFGVAQIDAIEANVWAWPRRTLRQNGDVVDSPRDIIDSGELRDSLSIDPTGELSVSYQYSSDHAGQVYFGEEDKDRPARPWIERAIEEDPPIENLATEIKKRIG